MGLCAPSRAQNRVSSDSLLTQQLHFGLSISFLLLFVALILSYTYSLCQPPFGIALVSLDLPCYTLSIMSTEITTTEQQLPIYQEIARFQGNPYRFLLFLLRNPGASLNDARRSINLATSPGSLQGWKQLPGFRDVLERLKAPTEDLRLAYAKAAMLDSVPDVTDSMVDRAKGNGVASQRAGERILEATGVLKAPDSGESTDLSGIALRIYAGKQARIAIGVDTTQAGTDRPQIEGQAVQLEALPEH